MMLADRGKIAFIQTLFIHRRMVAGIVFGTVREFDPRIFGEIVFQSVEENPHMKGVPYHEVTMFEDGCQMSKGVRHA